MNFTNKCSVGGNCPKSGIKIHESNNEYKKNPFQSNVKLETCNFNFNLSDYKIEDIYRLFQIENKELNDNVMKNSRKFLLKLHPDKSGLDPQYFIFYSKAFDVLQGVYDFQNKSEKKKINMGDYSEKNDKYTFGFSDNDKKILNNMFDKNEMLKDSKNFNLWFNEQFDKYGKDNANVGDYGYESWFKSDEGIMNENIDGLNEKNLNEKFEAHKKKTMQVVVYDEINSYNSQSGFSDLKQAYNESIIPINEDYYNNVKKYNNVNEYINEREIQDTKPLDREEANKLLMRTQEKESEQSAMMAYEYAVQLEKSKNSNKGFWTNMKTLGF